MRQVVLWSIVVTGAGCSGNSGALDGGRNEIPSISITSPIAGFSFLESEPVPVMIAVEDPDEPDLSTMRLEWLDAARDVGAPLHPDPGGTATFDLPPLLPGEQTVNVTVYDPQGANGSATVTFLVERDSDADGYAPDVDCNDDDPTIDPGAQEFCNGIDDDCANGPDDGVPLIAWYLDLDLDGYGNPANVLTTCEDLSATRVDDATDCNDNAATIHPGAEEVCNGLDDDCANGPDDSLTFVSWYPDVDDDGYGNPDLGLSSCNDLSATRILDGTDCNDLSAVLNHDDADLDLVDSCAGDCNDFDDATLPGAVETCNDNDDNCIGGIDEGFAKSDWYLDVDGDGYGNAATLLSSCVDHSATRIADGTDCNDASATLNHDNVDGDAFDTCAGDCDDTAAGVFPGALEACNGIDDNCKGGIDDGVVDIDWFVDGDGDGYGDPLLVTTTCEDLSADHVADGTDCDDLDPALNRDDADSDGVDTCDGDCDDADPIAVFEDNWLPDADGDGYGDENGAVVAFQCHAPADDTAPEGLGLDCDDTLATVNPGADEVCGDGIDDDCSGADQACGPIGSFVVSDGPSWVLDPPVVSCLDACALLFGGVATDYNCSTDKAVLNYLAFVDGWGDSQFCTNPAAEDFKLEQAGNPGYNCGAGMCSYSAFVLDHSCMVTNYCWLK